MTAMQQLQFGSRCWVLRAVFDPGHRCLFRVSYYKRVAGRTLCVSTVPDMSEIQDAVEVATPTRALSVNPFEYVEMCEASLI